MKFDNKGGSETAFEVQRFQGWAAMDARSGLVRESIADGGDAFDEVAGGGDVEALSDFTQEDERQGAIGRGRRGLIDDDIHPWQMGREDGPAWMGFGFIYHLPK